jgi:hypothetical protein
VSAERRWFPVAPSIFDEAELSPTRPYEDERPAFFIAADFEPAPVIDRSPLPLVEVLARLHSDIIFERRTLDRENRRLAPSVAVIRSINERITFYQGEIERLLNALVWHEQTWAHLADDCAICDRSVSHR